VANILILFRTILNKESYFLNLLKIAAYPRAGISVSHLAQILALQNLQKVTGLIVISDLTSSHTLHTPLTGIGLLIVPLPILE